MIDWTYDALGRLTQEASHDVSGARLDVDYTEDFVFDLAGNRIETSSTDAAGTVTTMTTYNGNGEATSDVSSLGSIIVYTYDANGSLIETTSNGNVVARYVYDSDNQLSSATTYTKDQAGNSVTTTSNFIYDSSGDRVSTEVITQVNGSQTSDVKQSDLFDPNNPTGLPQILEEHDQTGAVTMTFVSGSATILQVSHLDGGDEYRYFLLDGHNSTRLLTDQNGVITDRFDYDADGNALDFDATTAATTRLYSGYTFDRSTGLYDLNARYYDPSVGRFDESDPFSGDTTDPQSLNKYLYAQGDPVNYVDPNGREVDLVEEISTLGRGSYVHNALGQDFEDRVYRGLSDESIANILPGAVPPEYSRKRPDLISPFHDYDVYEIKPDNSYYRGDGEIPGAGPEQLQGYIEILEKYDPVGRPWRLGLQSTYTAPPTIPDPLDGGVFLTLPDCRY